MPGYDLNGIHLNVESQGSGHPLVMLHGFTGSTQAWQGIPERLAKNYRVILLDIIGHGDSSAPVDPDRYRINYAVDDITAFLDRLGLKRVTLLGYSLGGRIALHLALAHPERIDTLILESAAPGIADAGARAERRRSDEKLARMIETEKLERFIEYWESIPLFASQQRLPESTRQQQRAIRMAQRPVGLANSLRGMGAGAMEPVIDRLGELAMPVWYIAGELDDKYRKLGQDMVARIPDARYCEVSGAGHTAHLEQPRAYVDLLSGIRERAVG